MAYMSLTKQNLPIFGIAKAKQLVDFTTTEKDVSRGISRMPLILARLYEEDIKFEKALPSSATKFKTSPKSLQQEQMSEAERMIENLNDSILHRNSARISKKVAGLKDEAKTLDGDLDFDER